MKPGIYTDISNEDYHSGPGISKSGLDKIHKSPLHYKHSLEAEFNQTPSMKIGSLAHALILEPENFWDLYARPFVANDEMIATMDDMKSLLKDLDQKTSGKKDDLKERIKSVAPDTIFLDDAKADYYESSEGKEIISEEEYQKACDIRDAVMSHPIAGKALAPGEGVAEVSAYWTDKETGELCRCRPDFWRKDGKIVDLKTTRDASSEAFSKSINDFRYYVQEPFYMDGLKEALAQNTQDVIFPEPKVFLFVAVEATAPHAVSVYYLEKEASDIGREEYKKDLREYAASKKKDKWNGYSTKIEPISLPAWRLAKEFYQNEEIA